MRTKYKKEIKQYIKDSQDSDFNFIGKDKDKMDRLTKKFYFKEQKKKAFALYNREQELRKIKDEYVKLDNPIHVGFIKYFVIKADVHEKLKNTGKLETLKTILNRINVTILSKNRLFVEKYGVRKKKNKFKRKALQLKHISVRDYELLTEEEKNYFQLVTVYHKYSKSLHNIYVFSKMDLLQEKIAPYFITHKKVMDSNLESEKAYVWNKFWNWGSPFQKIVFGSVGGSYRYGEKPEDIKAYYTEKEFLDDVKNN